MLETLDETTEASFRQAGWEPCYHRGNGSAIHTNVKVHGNYKLESEMFSKLANELPQTEDDIRRVAQEVHDREMETWWEDLLDRNVDHLLSGDDEYIGTGLQGKDYWSDGRQGGWLHVTAEWALQDPKRTELLAEHAKGSVDYYSTQYWYDHLAEQVTYLLEEFPDAGAERCHCCGQTV